MEAKFEAYFRAVEAAALSGDKVPVEVAEAAGRGSIDVEADVKQATHLYVTVPAQLEKMRDVIAGLQSSVLSKEELAEVVQHAKDAEMAARVAVSESRKLKTMSNTLDGMERRLDTCLEGLEKQLTSDRSQTVDYKRLV